MALSNVAMNETSFLGAISASIRKNLTDQSDAIVAESLKSIEAKLRDEIAKTIARVVISLFNDVSFERMGPTLRIEVRLPKKEGI